MENLLPEPVTETSIEAIRVETALSRFPVHSLTGGVVDINLHNLGTATKWEVSYSTRYGTPGQLAYKIDTLIINRRIEEAERPVGKIIRIGSLKEIANEISTKENSKTSDTGKIKRALLQNAFAGISAKISYKTKEGSVRDIEFADTRYGVIFTGDKLPDGRKADCVYIMLHDFYREILNFAVTRPLDYDYMKALPPMAQRFYEIISYVIFAALHHRNKSCKMRYSEFCKLSTATRYYEFDKVKKQMYKIHKPHVENGYIERGITYQPTTDEEGLSDWWMFYVPGPNAGRQYAEFTAIPRKRVGAIELPSGQAFLPFLDEVPAIPPKVGKSSEPSTNEEKQVPSPETQALTDELVRAGMSRGEAITLAALHPEECRRQLEYLPYAEIKSTPGAYLTTAIKREFAAPKGFQEFQQKKAEAESRRKAEELRISRERVAKARQEAEMMALDSEILALESEAPKQHAEFIKFIEAEKAKALNKPFFKPESRAAEVMAKSFDTPEKQRELYQQWKAQA